MFDKEGNNLANISGEYPTGKNLFDIYETVQFAPGYSLEKLKSDWQSGTEGYSVYFKEDIGNTYVYYKNVPGTDWIITSLMRESNINTTVEAGSQRMVLSSVLLVVIVTVSFVILFFFILRAAGKIRQSQSDREQLKIVGALSNDYSDVFLIDLVNDKSATLKEHGKIHAMGEGGERSYTETWENFTEQYVAQQDRERVLQLVDAENITAVINENDEFSFDFKVNVNDKTLSSGENRKAAR